MKIGEKILVLGMICLLGGMGQSRLKGEESGKVRIAGIVLKWIFGDRDANLRRAEYLIREAAAKGAKIVCTAESFLDGYSVRDEEMPEKDFHSLAELIPTGPYYLRLQSICKELHVYLIAGLTEKADGKVFNSAVLIGPEGKLLGTYRKKFLWPSETSRYTAGSSFPVFATEYGRIGMMICSDRRQPEAIKELASNKADIVFCLAGGGYGKENDKVMCQRSLEGGMPIVFVHPIEFLVTGPSGEILVQNLYGDTLDDENKDSIGGIVRFFDVALPKNTCRELTGPYLGQKPPGMVPEQFGVGTIDRDEQIFAIAFSPDGRECFYTKSFKTNAIMTAGETDGRWTEPKIADFSGKAFDFEPHITIDGQKMIFGSMRPFPGAANKEELRQWLIEKKDDGWSEPIPLGPPFNDRFCMYVSVAENGAIYFTGEDGIYLSKFANGKYASPEKLPDAINHLKYAAHPFVAQDESYLLFDAQPQEGNAELFITFQKNDKTWSKPQKLDANFNTDQEELCASVTRDGKYLFFSRLAPGKGDIFWVDAKIIETLRPKN